MKTKTQREQGTQRYGKGERETSVDHLTGTTSCLLLRLKRIQSQVIIYNDPSY